MGREWLEVTPFDAGVMTRRRPSQREGGVIGSGSKIDLSEAVCHQHDSRHSFVATHAGLVTRA